ncbi:MAG TPA: hypothetical protein VGN42_04080, partial [Pirellulales bacterium]|nr:hypothetical protein [Pirellulales bacterium]
NSDAAELAAPEDESEKIATDNRRNSADPTPADNPLAVPPNAPEAAASPASRRRLARVAAATAALVLLGASAGGLTGWLVPAVASSPAMANGPAATDQQRIEALRREIAELQSERERLAQATQAESPKPSAADPAAAEAPVSR